jgi:ribosomal protein L15E
VLGIRFRNSVLRAKLPCQTERAGYLFYKTTYRICSRGFRICIGILQNNFQPFNPRLERYCPGQYSP